MRTAIDGVREAVIMPGTVRAVLPQLGIPH